MGLISCKQCGRQVPEDTWVCSHCGCAQPGEHTSQVEAPAETPAETSTAAPPGVEAPPAQPGPALPGESLPSGNDPSVLPELEGWNWGAYGLNWIWALAHRVTLLWLLALLAWLVWGVVGLAFAGYLGSRGNELAWRHRPFRDVEEFWAVQRAWARWGIAVFALQILLVICVLVIAARTFAAVADSMP